MFLVFRFIFLLPAAGDEPCLVCCLFEISVVLLKDLDPVAFREDQTSPGMLLIPGPRETAPVPCLSIRIKGRSRWKDATPACSERPLPAGCGAGAGAGLSVSGAKIPAVMNPVGPLST